MEDSWLRPRDNLGYNQFLKAFRPKRDSWHRSYRLCMTQKSETPSSTNAEGKTVAPLILIAEDDFINREVLVDFVSYNQFRVIEASDGIEALKQMEAQQPDLILMDVRMPKLDGLSTMRQIRENGNSVPIIALTGSAMTGDNHRCIQAGATAYLTKPVSLVALIKTINRHLPNPSKTINPIN